MKINTDENKIKEILERGAKINEKLKIKS